MVKVESNISAQQELSWTQVLKLIQQNLGSGHKPKQKMIRINLQNKLVWPKSVQSTLSHD